MINFRTNKGITMLVLVVMIIILGILAGISITKGSDLLEYINIENYITNMVTIKAKAKGFAEEVNAKTWTAEDSATARRGIFESSGEKYQMTYTTEITEYEAQVATEVKANGCEYYKITSNTLDAMGLGELTKKTNSGDYIVVYNSKDYTKSDIIYKPGIKYKKEMYYTLSSIQNAMGNENED